MVTNIVDNNRKGLTLASLLNKEFKACDSIAIATAYFNIRGFGAIKEGLLNNNIEALSNITESNIKDKPLRLLLGREPSEEIKFEDKIIKELEKEQEENEDNDSYYNLLQECVEYFESDKREVRIMQGQFFHGKCYIGISNNNDKEGIGIGIIGVVGSSNFTYGGLISNRELNMYTKDKDAIKELHSWFEEQWKDSMDYKGEFLKALKNYVTSYSPYDIIAKALYETYKDQIDSNKDNTLLKDMHIHQRISYLSAKKKLEEYNGVIIADSTGLGKTMIALNIIHDMQREGKRIILIAPKSILDNTWMSEMRRLNITLHPDDMISMEYLSHNPDEVISKLANNDVGLIVIDEAHYFRNPSSNRHKALKEIIAKFRPKIVMLTATPINTSLMDLYNLFSLYLPDNALIDMGIDSLRDYFITQQRKWLERERIDMDKVLQRFMVRHSRQFAQAVNKDLHFPKRILKSIEYDLGIDYEDIYNRLDYLNFAFYDLSVERVSNKFKLPDGTPIEDIARQKERIENLKEIVKLIVKINILKRLESSLYAYNSTIDKLLKYIDMAICYAKYEGYFIPPKLKGDILQLYDEEEDDVLPDPEDIFKDKNLMNSCRLSNEEIKEFVDKCEKDKEILKGLKISTDDKNNSNNRDYKFAGLVERIKELYPIIRGNKVNANSNNNSNNTNSNNNSNANNNGIIIFTQYYDTAIYLYNELRKMYKDDVMLVSGKECKDKKGNPKNDNDIIKEFQQGGGILVTTDKLSAGQNLQNAQYVINYDFPWNPVVLIQRVGRVDRLGSRYDEVYLVNVLPSNRDPDDPSSLTHFLSVFQRLNERLTAINQTIGLDASHLGEHAMPKDFTIYTNIANNDPNVLVLLEKSVEQFTNEPMDVLANMIKEHGLDYLKGLPDGIGALKRSDREGLFVLFSVSYSNKHELYWRLKFYNKNKNEIIDNQSEIINIILGNDNDNNNNDIKGKNIEYNKLLPLLKEMKKELLDEIKSNLRKKETMVAGSNKVIKELFDKLAEEDEELAIKFRNHSNKSYIVDTLKKADREGKLIEKAREILANIKNDSSDDDNKINDSNIKIRRVCWCYLGNIA
jgi:superfamily II DNA or RNA helicase